MRERRTLTVLFFTLFLDMVGIGMLIPLIPALFTDTTSSHFLLAAYSEQSRYLIAGLITALFGLMQFIAAPVLGELSDVYGRKKLLMFGVGLLALSQAVFGFGIEIASLSLILVSRAVAGLAGANFSIAQATIADVSTPEHRARNFGLIGAAFGLGFIVGPVLGGWIAHSTGNPASPFWFAAVLGMVNMLLVFFFLPETHAVKVGEVRHFTIGKGIQNVRAAMHSLSMRQLYLAQFLYMSGFTFFTSFSSIFVVERFGFSEGEIGTFFGVMGLCMVITQALILRVVSKYYTPQQILPTTLLMLAMVLLVYPLIPSVFLLYAILPLLAIAQGLSMANMGAFISLRAGPESQGAALGISGSLIALSQGIVPILAGLGSGVIGIALPFVVGGMCVLSSWWVVRKI